LNPDLKAELGSERTCVVTKTKGSPDEMIRFVLGPDARVVPDLRHKLPGRGVWVTARADKIAEAVKRKAFARGLKGEAVASADLPAEVEALLTVRCFQALSMAKKAGEVVAGFAKVEAAIRTGAIAGLIQAKDGAPDGHRKLAQALRQSGSAATIPIIDLFTSEQLSLALGGTNVIHAALAKGAASTAFLSWCGKLDRYRSVSAAVGCGEVEGAQKKNDEGGKD